MDTKALGQDLVDLEERLSDLKGDAFRGFSRGVQSQPAGAVLLALGVGVVFGFLLGLVSKEAVTANSDEPRSSTRRSAVHRRRTAAGQNDDDEGREPNGA
jgi:hypothetical protein